MAPSDLYLYLDYFDDTTEELLQHLQSEGLDCSFYPEFKLLEHKGFLSTSLIVTNSKVDNYQEFGKAIFSGIEFNSTSFSYEKKLEEHLKINPQSKKSFLQKMAFWKTDQSFIVSEEIDGLLKSKTSQIQIHYGIRGSSECRLAHYIACFFLKKYNGILQVVQDNLFLKSERGIQHLKAAVDRYESDLSAEEWYLEPFEGWD